MPRPSLQRLALPLSLLLALALAGCPARHPRPDAGVPPGDADLPEDDAAMPDSGSPLDGGEGDAGTLDAGTLDAGMRDAGMRDAGMRDGGMPGSGSEPAPPAEILRTGSGGFLLRGTVLAPSGPISPGEVLIVADTITCVAADCSSEPMADAVTVIDTHAVISAGLIDAHNHATYDFLPEWIPDPLEIFGNRYQWADDPDYEAHIMPEAAGGNSASFVCPATKWAELRSIVHGTTTIMGQSPRQTCADRLARNADHYHRLGSQTLWPYIGSIRDVADSRASGTDRMDLIANFENGTWTRYAVHMAEGVIGGGSNIDREFASYVGREPRTAPTTTYTINLLTRPDGSSYGTAMFIHAIAMTPEELDEAIDAGAYFVWSPSSNILLYGRTADVARMLAQGANVGLGPDWTVSGSDEMLSELRFAEEWAAAEGVSAITSAVLHRMATEGSARAVGLDAAIGRLAPGMRADVAVFGRVASDPYRAVIDSHAADVRLVMIDGAAYYGDLALEGATAVNGDCDGLDACGTSKFLCAANTPGHTTRMSETVDDVRGQLRAHLATFGRADELLELVDCSL